MPLTKRHQLRTARALAATATAVLPGRARVLAWMLHEILRLSPTLIRNCDWHGPVAKRFRTENREVWLTVDDGPDPEQTPQMLDLLAASGAHASFFAVGRNIDRHRELARRIIEGGHTLENHTYSHPSALFWTLPCCAIREEISRCSHAIRVATGRTPTWFRSPVGMTNPCVHPAAAGAWLRLAGWSADGLDGLAGRNPVAVAKRIMKKVTPGAIILLHDGGRGRRSAEALSILLDRLAEEDYRCVIPAVGQII